MVTVTVVGMDKVQRGLSNAPKHLADETKTTMQAALLLLEGEQKKTAPRDTGRLQGSVHHTITGRGASLTGRVGPSVRYAIYVEKGRRPGRYPPIDAVAGWARRHGVHPFLVARAIARRGVKPRPFVEPALTKHKSAIVRMFDKIGVKIATSIASGR